MPIYFYSTPEIVFYPPSLLLQVGKHEDVPVEIRSNSNLVSCDGIYPSWVHLVKSWVSRKHQMTRNHLVELCSMYTEETLKYMKEKFDGMSEEERAQKEYHLVFTLLKMFDVSYKACFTLKAYI